MAGFPPGKMRISSFVCVWTAVMAGVLPRSLEISNSNANGWSCFAKISSISFPKVELQCLQIKFFEVNVPPSALSRMCSCDLFSEVNSAPHMKHFAKFFTSSTRSISMFGLVKQFLYLS